ncbi:MAG: hypothetical protein ICV59_01620 [Thermoleophilia bacterium]|nr:hypothetical protein [Thermoleophilia bacterium]
MISYSQLLYAAPTVAGEPPAPPARGSERMADVRLRVPADVKHEIERAAERAGLPPDAWLVDTIGRSLGSASA